MANNDIYITVSNQKQSLSVSASGGNNRIGITGDNSQYFSNEARKSAQQAQQSSTQAGKYAEQSQIFANSAQESYNQIQNSVEVALGDVDIAVQTAISTIDTKSGEAIETINNSVGSGIGDIKTETNKQISNIQRTGFYMRDDKLYFINSEGEEEEFKSGGGGLEIGDIGIAPLGIDETQGKRRYLNGQVIIQEQYVEFTNKVKSAVDLYPSLACTESEWQTTATMSAFGACGKFVVDDEAGTIRLPKITGFIQGLNDLASLGDLVEAGLPNITGSFSAWTDIKDGQGAFFTSYRGTANTGDNQYAIDRALNFDASRSSSIYGNSNTVQPESIQYPYFIQVATGAETEDNIINEIELNNPFSLLDYKYSEYELNNLSWLRSNGQYNSKAVYPSVYELLLKIYNGTETKAGVSVKLNTEDFSDVDFVLNTTEEIFRLPISVNNSAQGYLYFYVGETVQNANLINAGRIEEKLSECITRNNKEEIVGWSMPDYSAGVEIASVLKTSPYSYTAPCDGVIRFYSNGDHTWSVRTNNSSSDPMTNLVTMNFSSGDYATCFFPITAGMTIYNVSGKDGDSAIFYPLKGVK